MEIVFEVVLELLCELLAALFEHVTPGPIKRRLVGHRVLTKLYQVLLVLVAAVLAVGAVFLAGYLAQTLFGLKVWD